MKRFAKLAVASAIAIVGVFGFAGCKDSDTLTNTPNAGITAGVSESVGKYSSVAYFETERPDDVKIAFETDKIQKVSFKYRVLDSKEYKFKNDTLTIKQSVFENESSGDKRIRVFVDNKYVEITVRVVTKVIYTTEDFNSIRTNLNGVYVLGADIDFGNEEFNPIGKPLSANESTGVFEGVFDGMGYSVKNVTINAYDRDEGEDEYGQGPVLGGEQGNGRNYNNGIFMSTSGNAQIINTNFVNIKVDTQGMGGAVAGFNGGLIKNCRVSCTLSSRGWFEKAGGICGVNGSVDTNGRIENCVVTYTAASGYTPRGIADWNNGIIRNCYAAPVNNYVFHIGYDSETGKVPDNFDYDDFVNELLSNGGSLDVCFGYPTLVALPGSMNDGTFYKGGDIINSEIVVKEFLLNPANFPKEDGWDTDVWNFTYGAYPSLKIQSR
ncbi:MAG: hypothetical protein K2I30_06460 [Clostridia bacterium]|nr:hypothetical protein [Clostridia bacterium]